MRTRNLLAVGTGLIILIAGLAYLWPQPHEAATRPDAPSPSPDIVVSRNATPDGLLVRITGAAYPVVIVADDPSAGVLDSWNATNETPHVSNYSTWPHLFRLRAVSLDGATLVRWVWIGNHTMTTAGTVADLIAKGAHV